MILFSQTPVIRVIQGNQVRAALNARGELFNAGNQGLFVPVEPGLPEHTLVASAGIWLAGLDPAGNVRASIQVPDTWGPTDFAPGPTGWPAFHDVWVSTAADVQAHRADFADNQTIDTPVSSVLGWPGAGNAFFDQYGSVPGPLPPGSAAGFYDQANAGTYNPDQGDYPTISLTGCLDEIVPDQLAWTVSNDQTAESVPGIANLGLRLRTEVYAFQSEDASVINRAVFVHYLFTYEGTEPLDSAYLGLWTQFRIGNPGDDFAGFAPERRVVFGYQGDADDEAGFGASAPALGVKLLRGPLIDGPGDPQEVPLAHVLILDGLESSELTGLYQLLNGRYPDGQPAPNNGFLYTGNPNDPGGWSEITAGNTPGTRMALATYGPFRLNPGSTNDFYAAYFYGYSAGSTPLENVQMLYDSAEVVSNAWGDCFSDFNNQGLSGVGGPASDPGATARLYPNPATLGCTVERSAAPFAHIEVLDLAGRRVWQRTLAERTGRYELAVDQLPAGFYALRLDGGITTLPLVVAR